MQIVTLTPYLLFDIIYNCDMHDINMSECRQLLSSQSLEVISAMPQMVGIRMSEGREANWIQYSTRKAVRIV